MTELFTTYNKAFDKWCICMNKAQTTYDMHWCKELQYEIMDALTDLWSNNLITTQVYSETTIQMSRVHDKNFSEIQKAQLN